MSALALSTCKELRKVTVKRQITKRLMPLGVLLAFLCTVALVLWGYVWDGSGTISTLLSDSRASVYGTLTSLFGILFGFTITTASICLNLTDQPRFYRLRATKAYRKLWSYFLWAIVVLGIGALVTLFALFIDQGKTPMVPLFYAVVFVLVLAVCFLGNCIYALKLIIDIAAQRSASST